MAKLNELAGALDTIGSRLKEARDELAAKIDALEAALQDIDIPAEAQENLDAVATLADNLANIVPDAAPEPPIGDTRAP